MRKYGRVIFADVDGTLVDNRRRGHFAPTMPVSQECWAAFNAQCLKDEINWPMVQVYQALGRRDDVIARILVTSRPALFRELTLQSDPFQVLTFDKLVMRENDDLRSCAEYKSEVFDRYHLRQGDFVLEDSISVLQTAKDRGAITIRSNLVCSSVQATSNH